MMPTFTVGEPITAIVVDGGIWRCVACRKPFMDIPVPVTDSHSSSVRAATDHFLSAHVKTNQLHLDDDGR